MADETLPKELLLRKLLKMSDNTNDGEALTAISKFHSLLKASGWDVDKLFDAKIKIIENPFNKVANVQSNKRTLNESTIPNVSKPTTDPGAGNMWEWNPAAAKWEVRLDPFYVPPRRQRPPMPRYSPGVGNMWQWSAMQDAWVSVQSPINPTNQTKAQRASTIHSSFGNGKPHGLTKPNIYANSCYCCGDHVAVKVGWVFNPGQDYSVGPNKWEVMCEPCNQAGATIPYTKARPTHKPAGAPPQGSVNLGSL